MRPARVAKALLALGITALGCQSLIGLEERHKGDETWCVDYCDTVMAQCPAPAKVYSSRATCLGVCSKLDQGGPDDPPKSNTVYCRDTLIANSAEAAVDCALSGPGGGDQCGSDCEGYCQILIASCDNVPTQDLGECVRQCGALRRSSGGFNISAYTHEDSLSCRLFYASEATVDPANNCRNAVIAQPNPEALCTEPATAEPKCEDYCRVAMNACTGSNSLYESNAQCLKACAAIPLGTNADSGGVIDESTPKNTIGCRKFHAYGALANPDIHCHHSGPTGDGYCGDEDDAICESYCLIAKAACGAVYAARFADDAACEADCKTLPGTTEDTADDPVNPHEYSLKSAKKGGDQVPCRTLHALRVLDATAANPTTDCQIALGTLACPVEP